MTLANPIEPPNWVLRQCTGSAERFDPDHPRYSPSIAKTFCENCPIQRHCADYALDRPDLVGIYGGLTDQERQQRRTGKPAPWRKKEAAHGTVARYYLHLKDDELPCGQCCIALIEDPRARRRGQRASGARAGSAAG